MTAAEIKAYKDSLYSALSRDLSDFEKNFLLISAGVLTFSITFIKDIIKVDEAHFLCTLFAGWFLFAVSVGVMMITFISSAYASDEISKTIDDFMGGREVLNDEDSKNLKVKTRIVLRKSKEQLKNMRYWAIASFLTGFLSFGFFVSYNLLKENEKSSNNKNNKTINLMLKDIKAEITDSTINLKKIK